MVVELSVAIACEDERKRNEMRMVSVWVEGIDVEGNVSDALHGDEVNSRSVVTLKASPCGVKVP